MLICNYSYINQICGHNHSGVTNPVWVIAPHRMRGYYGKAQYESLQEQVKRDSFPTGTNNPYAIIMGDKGALLSSTTTISGDSDLTANASQGINIEGALSGTSSVTSSLSLVTALNASLTGVGTLTASLVGSVALNAALSGTSNVTAGLGLIANMVSTIAGTSSVSANLKGTLSMEAAIYVNESEFTVTQLVDAMWNAVAADYNNSGTMGELLNGAGGGATPSVIADAVWDEILSAHNISGSTGEKLSKLLEKIQFLYLKD